MAYSSKGYKGFNSPSGSPGKSAGGGRLLYKASKKLSHANETCMPGQDAGAMASMGTNRYTGESAATQTGTVRKAK